MKNTIASILEGLTIKGWSGGEISLDGVKLGAFVTHGHQTMPGKTVYASRISKPVRIEVEAANLGSLETKVATELARALKTNNLSRPLQVS